MKPTYQSTDFFQSDLNPDPIAFDFDTKKSANFN